MRTLYIFLLFCTIMAACKKKNDVPHSGVLTGNWELRSSVGGIAGTINYTPGNGNIYSFYEDGKYQYGFNNVYQTGSYTLKATANSNNWMLERTSVVNNQTSTSTDSVHISDNQLIFIPRETCCDMPTITYVKILGL